MGVVYHKVVNMPTVSPFSTFKDFNGILLELFVEYFNVGNFLRKVSSN